MGILGRLPVRRSVLCAVSPGVRFSRSSRGTPDSDAFRAGDNQYQYVEPPCPIAGASGIPQPAARESG
jgi:hypothetical protein